MRVGTTKDSLPVTSASGPNDTRTSCHPFPFVCFSCDTAAPFAPPGQPSLRGEPCAGAERLSTGRFVRRVGREYMAGDGVVVAAALERRDVAPAHLDRVRAARMKGAT